MFGPPKDIEGGCNAHLYIGDDYGDNTATMRCDLPAKHDGLHTHSWASVRVTWEVDERAEPEAFEAEQRSQEDQ